MAKDIIFRTAYANLDKNLKGQTPVGSPIQDEYGYEINAYGQKILVKTGETNLYEKIQASLEETKIENILARAAAGDTTVFRPEGMYADLTQMPSNLLEARHAMQQLENTWNGLDNEIKKKYNYDLDQFIGQSGSESWLKDMGLLKSEVATVEKAVASSAASSVEEGGSDE